MGHATAADMLTHFKTGMALLNPSSSVQIFIDDPNVNWKFYLNLFQERKGEELPDLLNIFSNFSNIQGIHKVFTQFKKFIDITTDVGNV